MAADVRSIDALREWYGALATYGSDLAEALSGVEMEIRRGYDWLGEQFSRWQNAMRDLGDEVTRAKAELATRKFPDWSGRDPDTTVQEKALRQAKARLEYAEDQVTRIRSWMVRLPRAIEEHYSGASRLLAGFLEVDLPRALAGLDQRVGSLESYAGLRADYAPSPSISSVPTPPPLAVTPTNEEPKS